MPNGQIYDYSLQLNELKEKKTLKRKKELCPNKKQVRKEVKSNPTSLYVFSSMAIRYDQNPPVLESQQVKSNGVG